MLKKDLKIEMRNFEIKVTKRIFQEITFYSVSFCQKIGYLHSLMRYNDSKRFCTKNESVAIVTRFYYSLFLGNYYTVICFQIFPIHITTKDIIKNIPIAQEF